MALPLQVVLFIAACTVIVLGLCLIPLAFVALRQIGALARSAEQVKVDVQAFLQDSRELVRHVDELSRQTTRELDDVARITRVVESWVERGDRVANAVGAVVEPAVFGLARNMGLVRLGASVFLKSMLRGRQRNETAQEK